MLMKKSAFVGHDEQGNTGCAIIYNVRMGLVKPNDVITIASPKLVDMSIETPEVSAF